MTKRKKAASRNLHATALVVFGATGDLTQNKLYPALYELAERRLLPEDFFVYGIAREDMSQAGFVADIRRDLKRHYGRAYRPTIANRLLNCVRYIAADLNDLHGYERLEADIRTQENELGHGIMRVFYLALPPALFADVVGHVNSCKLGKQMCTLEKVRSRVVLEKPFGYSLTTARQLDRQVRRVFDERQVYRIDHYLGKEPVQNIKTFRFANNLFEDHWNRKYISEIQLCALETVGLEQRQAYYDRAGAIRDMVQNHLLQLLAYLTMDRPVDDTMPALRQAKERLLAAVRPYGGRPEMVRGQFRGYRRSPGVGRGSRTETYVALKLEIDSPRWRGVPIYVRTGKSLEHKETSARVTFRQDEKSVFQIGSEPNRLGIAVSPHPGISVNLNVLQPGFAQETQTAPLHYCRNEAGLPPAVGDYEQLLLRVFEGDQRLFTSSREVLNAWQVVQPFLKRAERDRIHQYPVGSLGPKAADRLLMQDGTAWLPPLSGCPACNL